MGDMSGRRGWAMAGGALGGADLAGSDHALGGEHLRGGHPPDGAERPGGETVTGGGGASLGCHWGAPYPPALCPRRLGEDKRGPPYRWGRAAGRRRRGVACNHEEVTASSGGHSGMTGGLFGHIRHYAHPRPIDGAKRPGDEKEV